MDNIENQAKAEALYKQIGQYVSESDVQKYEAVLELNPKHILSLWKLGLLYKGDYDHPGHGSDYDEFKCVNKPKAKECFTKIIEIDPKYHQAYYRLAKIQQSQDKEKALMHYLQYLNLNPEDYNAIADTAHLYYLHKRNQEATAYFIKCLQHNQKDIRALDGLACVNEDEGKYNEALKFMKRSLEIYDKCAEKYAHIARIYDKMGNTKEALNCYRKCNHLRADHKEANAYIQKNLKNDLKH